PAAKPFVPSSNPEYANPTNEIWLDVRTDATGSGTSHTTVPFTFTDRGPGSIVVHDQQQTTPGTGQANETNDRGACLTLKATPYGASALGQASGRRRGAVPQQRDRWCGTALRRSPVGFASRGYTMSRAPEVGGRGQTARECQTCLGDDVRLGLHYWTYSA